MYYTYIYIYVLHIYIYILHIYTTYIILYTTYICIYYIYIYTTYMYIYYIYIYIYILHIDIAITYIYMYYIHLYIYIYTLPLFNVDFGIEQISIPRLRLLAPTTSNGQVFFIFATELTGSKKHVRYHHSHSYFIFFSPNDYVKEFCFLGKLSCTILAIKHSYGESTLQRPIAMFSALYHGGMKMVQPLAMLITLPLFNVVGEIEQKSIRSLCLLAPTTSNGQAFFIFGARISRSKKHVGCHHSDSYVNFCSQ